MACRSSIPADLDCEVVATNTRGNLLRHPYQLTRMAGTALQAAVHLQADTWLGCSQAWTCKVPSAHLARLQAPLAVPFAHMPCCSIDLKCEAASASTSKLYNPPQQWRHDQFLQVAVRSLPDDGTGKSSFSGFCACLIRQSNAMPETALHIADPYVTSVWRDNIAPADLTRD